MFDTAGGKRLWPGTAVLIDPKKWDLLEEAGDWKCTVDFPEWK